MPKSNMAGFVEPSAMGDFLAGPPPQTLFQPPFPGSETSPASGADMRQLAINGSPLERARYVEAVLIQTDIFVHATASINALIERSRSLNLPGGLCITGEGGTGKSIILKVFTTLYKREETDARIYCPVLAIKLSGTPTPRQLLSSLLKALGYKSVRDSQTAPELMEILLKAMIACGVKIIFIDEAHHIIPVSGSRKNKERLAGELGDYSKDLYDRSAVPIVWTGKPSLGELFLADEQLKSRWPGAILLKEYACDDRWRVDLDVLDEALPMRMKAGLASVARAKMIHDVSKGNFRKLKIFLSESVRIASLSGASKLTDEHLKSARYALAL
jgi:Bacterial TniB protein